VRRSPNRRGDRIEQRRIDDLDWPRLAAIASVDGITEPEKCVMAFGLWFSIDKSVRRTARSQAPGGVMLLPCGQRAAEQFRFSGV
jgi:hypothetical protein